MIVAGQTDDVVTHQSFLHLFWSLQGFDYDIVVAYLHDEDAVGSSCPNLTLVVHSNGAHLPIGVVWIVFHHVLGMQGDVASALVLAEHVDTAAIGGHPDVALTVFYGQVGTVGTERVGVFVVMSEVDDVVSASRGRYLVDSVVLVADPVVALCVPRDAVGTAEGLSLGVVCDDGFQVHVTVEYEDLSALVAQQCHVTFLVVIHGTYLVGKCRGGFVD